MDLFNNKRDNYSYEEIEILAKIGEYHFHGIKRSKSDLFYEAQINIKAWKEYNSESDFRDEDIILSKSVLLHELRDLQKKIKPNTTVRMKVKQNGNIFILIDIIEMIKPVVEQHEMKEIHNNTYNFIYKPRKIIYEANVEYSVGKYKKYKDKLNIDFFVKKEETDYNIDKEAKEIFLSKLIKKYSRKNIKIFNIERIIEYIPWKGRPPNVLTGAFSGHK